jgi:hypothetical protein
MAKNAHLHAKSLAVVNPNLRRLRLRCLSKIVNLISQFPLSVHYLKVQWPLAAEANFYVAWKL